MGDKKYGECLKSHPHMDGKVDGCQKFVVVERSETEFCQICLCHRNYHRQPAPKYRKEVVYTKCHKIHTMLGNTVDGCQEFITQNPQAPEVVQTCVGCGCHKSFHRNEDTVQVPSYY